jgi:hypothetical protein
LKLILKNAVLHVRHLRYLFSIFCFVSSARTMNLVVPAHRSLAISQSIVVLGCSAWNALPHGMKICLRELHLFSL